MRGESIGRMDGLKRLEDDLKASEELQEKLEATCRRIQEAGKAESDGEIMVAAARELGYDVSIAVLEQARAEAEQLDPDELETVAGGMTNREKYKCGYGYMFNTELEDEYGHSAWCLTAWHCFGATLHTSTEEVEASCWNNYKCFVINE